MFDASDNVYEYLLCSLCPVHLSKPGLGYNTESNRIENHSQDWMVELPARGFLFPVFNDRYTDIHSASYGIQCDSSAMDNVKLVLENSILHNIGGDGLKAVNCLISVGNTQISNTLGHCVYLIGGNSEFVHCTLAQFYPWESVRGQALYLSDNYFSATVPLQKAHFYNCLITGYGEDVLLGSLNEKEQKYDYLFRNSLLNTPAVTDDARYAGCVFEGEREEDCCIREKGFVLFDTRNYLYDFAPDSCSAALQLADTVYTLRYPFDRNGVSRLGGKRPAAGCYEYVPRKK